MGSGGGLPGAVASRTTERIVLIGSPGERDEQGREEFCWLGCTSVRAEVSVGLG